MKSTTAELLKKHLDDNRFTIAPSSEGLKFDYELSDEEVAEIVEAEYGATLSAPVEDLFKVIIKKLVKMGFENATNNSDKLSDL